MPSSKLRKSRLARKSEVNQLAKRRTRQPEFRFGSERLDEVAAVLDLSPAATDHRVDLYTNSISNIRSFDLKAIPGVSVSVVETPPFFLKRTVTDLASVFLASQHRIEMTCREHSSFGFAIEINRHVDSIDDYRHVLLCRLDRLGGLVRCENK